MKLSLVSQRPTGSVPVFILPEGGAVNRHQFFSTLTKGDQEFLSAFLKKSPIKEGHVHFIFLPSGTELFLVGIPARTRFTHRKALLIARKVVQSARKERTRAIAIALDDFVTSGTRMPRETIAEVLATQCEIANFEFVTYKTAPPEGWMFVEEISLCVRSASATLKKAVARGKIIGEEMNHTRELANTPGMDMTPEQLAQRAVAQGKQFDITVRVLTEKEMKKLGMGGVLGVGQGSAHPPRFIVMEYLKGKKKEKPVVLVGKGITFDSGGLNLKLGTSLLEMHMDMSGGAAVMHVLVALARMGVRKNVIGLIPSAENMISGSSYHPNDVLRTMSGKTIEVLNTDAEGRIVLADGLSYAKQYNPRLVIDIATLTGASVVALGERTSALFTTDERYEKQLRALGEKTGDFVWPLPLWEEYEEEIKGTFGDVQNVGKKERYGGAITAAVFLWQFIKDTKWVHLDVAPRMTAIDGEFLAKGSAAPAVALLTHFVRNF